MRVLILQFVDPRQADPLPRFCHELGVLAALLIEQHVECRLVALGSRRGEALGGTLDSDRPDCVLAELRPYSVTAARRTLADIADRRLPTVVVGPLASCAPRQAVSFPGVTALVLGEYERTAARLLAAWRDGRAIDDLQGLWLQGEGGLRKGPVGPLEGNLDSLPFPNRDLFNYQRLVAAGGEAAFKTARGCPKWCAHCINDWFLDLYSQHGPFARRRSVGNVLAEVQQVLQRYRGVKALSFLDHSFAMDADWLRQFAEEYPRCCRLPYRCPVRLECVTPEVAAALAGSGCRWVHVHFGAGSRFIREEILSMHVSNEAILHACQVLRDAGLRILAEVFVGAPYESEITIDETVALLRKAQPDRIDARVFYPTPGTRAAELCAENGWISGRGEDNYWAGKTILDLPSLPAERIDLAAQKLRRMVRGRWGGLGRLLARAGRSLRRPPRAGATDGPARSA